MAIKLLYTPTYKNKMYGSVTTDAAAARYVFW